MSEKWDVYFTHVEGKPASMLLDLGLAEDAPIPGLSVMAYVVVDFLAPLPNGFCSNEEEGRLYEIEDALTDALVHETSIFVGRSTGDGQREFFFYMDNAKGVEECVEKLMEPFAEYSWDMGLVEEAGWDTYFEYLFPDEQGLDTIANNEVRRGLEAAGDKLSLPREIDYYLLFRSEADLAAFLQEAKQEGFTASAPEPDSQGGFSIVLHREDIPNDIDDVTWPLRELAGAHGGIFDGWGCAVTH